jgi:hypothetical protein
MTTADKRLLSGTPDNIRAQVEDLGSDQDDREYLTGTWFRELAVALAASGGLAVSAVSYDDPAVYDLEVALGGAPHHDAIVIGRSQFGDYCQISLERWLAIDGEPDIEHAVTTICSILAASDRRDPAGTTGATA